LTTTYHILTVSERVSHYKQKVAGAPQLNGTNSMFSFCSAAGRLFHTFGPATDKLLSPSHV